MIRVLRAALTCVVLLGGMTPVRADVVQDAEAQKDYQDGQTAYSLGDFAKAIERYRRAYELSRKPELLFNIAQAYRLSSDFKQALFFYESFLRNQPETPAKDEVEGRIEEMRQALTKVQETKQPPNGSIAPGQTGPTASDGEPEANDDQSEPPPPAPVTSAPPAGRGLRIAGLVTMGVGGAALIGGVLFGLEASAKSDAASQRSGVWDPSLERDGKAADRNMILLVGLGSAAVIGGGVLWYLGHRAGTRASNETAWRVTPGVDERGRASLVLRGGF